MEHSEIIRTVDSQIEAYQQRDLNLFLTYFSDEIELYLSNEDKPFISGKDAVKNYYQKLFDESPNLGIRIGKRMVQGDVIIDEEYLIGHRGSHEIKTLAVYEFKNKLISKARFYL